MKLKITVTLLLGIVLLMLNSSITQAQVNEEEILDLETQTVSDIIDDDTQTTLSEDNIVDNPIADEYDTNDDETILSDITPYNGELIDDSPLSESNIIDEMETIEEETSQTEISTLPEDTNIDKDIEETSDDDIIVTEDVINVDTEINSPPKPGVGRSGNYYNYDDFNAALDVYNGGGNGGSGVDVNYNYGK